MSEYLLVEQKRVATQERLTLAAIAMVSILMLAAWLVLPDGLTTPTSIVDGHYSNPCCNSVSIHDGAFFIDRHRVPFVLRRMKFGLEATPKQNIHVEPYGRVQIKATDDDHRSYILFDDDARGFTLLGESQREYRFRR